MLSILRNNRFIKVMGAYAAATTVRKSNGVEMKGDTIVFVAGIGTITSGGSCAMKLQGSDTDVDGNYVDLYDQANVAMTKTILDGDDDKMMVLEAVRPRYKYVRYVLTPATANVVIDYGLAIQSVHPRTLPATRDSTDSAYGHTSWIGGTAQDV